jgi:hypothetical protein
LKRLIHDIMKRLIHNTLKSSSFSSFEVVAQKHLKERGNDTGRWIFMKIEYLMVNSWKECLETTLELTNMKHVKVTEETEEVSNFW